MAEQFGHVQGLRQLRLLRDHIHTGHARAPIRNEIRQALNDSSREITALMKGRVLNLDLPVIAKYNMGEQHEVTEYQQRLAELRRAARHSTGTRALIAQGIGYHALAADGKRQMVVIKLATAQLGQKKWLPAAIEQGGWRHPVYADPMNVVRQRGKPFFHKTINAGQPRIEELLRSKVNRALNSTL